MERVEEMALAAWTEFYTQAQRRFGKKWPQKSFWDHRYRKTFLSIAKTCLDCRVEVNAYIAEGFDLITKNHRYITPADFNDNKLVDKHRKSKDSYGNIAQLAWTTQVTLLTRLECRLIPKCYSCEADILFDVDQTFSPWFRVLHPATFDEKIYSLWGDLAWQELHENPGLRDFAREQYPAGVKELEVRLMSFGDNITGVTT